MILDKAIVDLASALKSNLKSLATSLDQLCDVLLNVENRLQKLEQPPNIRQELVSIKVFIQGLNDEEKRTAALAEFAALCRVLDLEKEDL